MGIGSRSPGSLIGGLPETQEMLAGCGQHHLTCDIDLIRPDGINGADKRMLPSDGNCRVVIAPTWLG